MGKCEKYKQFLLRVFVCQVEFNFKLVCFFALAQRSASGSVSVVRSIRISVSLFPRSPSSDDARLNSHFTLVRYSVYKEPYVHMPHVLSFISFDCTDVASGLLQ